MIDHSNAWYIITLDFDFKCSFSLSHFSRNDVSAVLHFHSVAPSILSSYPLKTNLSRSIRGIPVRCSDGTGVDRSAVLEPPDRCRGLSVALIFHGECDWFVGEDLVT